MSKSIFIFNDSFKIHKKVSNRLIWAMTEGWIGNEGSITSDRGWGVTERGRRVVSAAGGRAVTSLTTT